MQQADTIREFHRLYYDSHVWVRTRWMGVGVEKCPLDLWIYQEIVAEKRPDVIVECGTRYGGSALYMAGICDLLGQGRVISIDISDRRGGLVHPRIEFLLGSSVDAATVDAVKSRLRPGEKVMIVLDTDHHRQHVLREMELYGPLVTSGQYMIVEDTNINGNPVAHYYGPGPKEALEEFLPKHPEFAADRSREKFFVTFHPGGFLLKR
jgi:cephalosporin hydroxylase